MAAETIDITIVNINKNTRKTLSFPKNEKPTFLDVTKRKGVCMLVMVGDDEPFSDFNAPLDTLRCKTFLKFTWVGCKGKEHPWDSLIKRQFEIRQEMIKQLAELVKERGITSTMLALVTAMQKK